MSAAEFSFWVDFRARHGFPADRLEGATAIAGAAVAGTWGAKLKPVDLLPRFGPRAGATGGQVLSYLTGFKNAKVERKPRKVVKSGRQ